MMRAAVASVRTQVRQSLGRAPIVAVVRSTDLEEARRQVRAYLASPLELLEVTFTVPRAPELVSELLAERGPEGPPWIGMGTVIDSERARRAVEVGAEFLVTPNVSREVATVAKEEGIFLILGALTPSELVEAHRLGADWIKVYPLPPVGGPAYLEVVRQPLGDLAPMLAGGGFGIEEIPAYRRAGATAFGLGARQLLGASLDESVERISRALVAARGESEAASPR